MVLYMGPPGYGIIIPKGPCTHIAYTLALKYSLYGCIGPKVYTIWVHGPLGYSGWIQGLELRTGRAQTQTPGASNYHGQGLVQGLGFRVLRFRVCGEYHYKLQLRHHHPLGCRIRCCRNTMIHFPTPIALAAYICLIHTAGISQRLQNPLLKEYTLNYNRIPI